MNIDPEFVDWLRRVEAEYYEMPGLRLTTGQMQRLWGLDARTCADIAAVLVARGVLLVTSKQTYALAATFTGDRLDRAAV